MQNNTKKVLWAVGLSNGDSFYEEAGKFCTIAGELSPWQRLLSYLAEKQVHITSLSLYTKDGQRWNLPSAGKNPKFKAFADAPKPTEFEFCRKMGGDIMNGVVQKEEHYAVAEARYEDGTRMQIWVDNETFKSWTLIV